MVVDTWRNSMAGPQDKAWSEGYAAGKRGRPETVSPYKKGAFSVAWQQSAG
jgi:ribosome modulation factor